MKHYVLILDIDHGVEEYFTQVVKAASFKEAIQKGYEMELESRQANPSDYSLEDYMDALNEVIEAETGEKSKNE